MKIILFLLIVSSFAFTSCSMQNQTVTAENKAAANDDKTQKPLQKSPVLIELFTSEG